MVCIPSQFPMIEKFIWYLYKILRWSSKNGKKKPCKKGHFVCKLLISKIRSRFTEVSTFTMAR